MKRIITLIIVLTTYVGFSQVVDGINYQAVALDANGREIPGIDINGNVIFESSFNVRFTVRSNALNGPIEYQETHTDVLTDNFGLFSLTIGHGQITSSSNQATLNDVNWGGDVHFLEVELDLEKTGEFKTMSNQQLMAVPYAFYALNADKVDWGNIENIPADIADGDDAGVGGTDDQNLTLTGTTLEIEGGNTVDLSTLQDGTGTDDQNLTLTGTTLAIEDGNTVDLSTLQDGTGTDDQNLTLTGTTLAIEDGNTVDLSTLQDGTGTDDQNLTLTGTALAIEDGNTVDLSTLQDGIGTDDQNLTLTGTTLEIEGGNTVDLSTLQDGIGTDDQNLTLTGTTLEIEGGNTVDLSTLQDGTGTDDQNLTLTGTTLEIEDGNTVDLSILQDGVDDADNDPTNEIDHDWYIQGTTDIPTNIDDEIFTNSNVLINGLYGDIGPVASTLLEPNNFRGLVIQNSDMNSGYKSVSLDLRSLNTDASIIGGNEISSNGANGYFAIETRNAETLVERFRINSQGNVGINVSNPSLLDTRFQVDGPVRFDNLTASDNTETSALLMNPSNRLVTRTLDAVAFNGEIDGDITNEIQDLDLTSNTLSLSNSVPTVDLSPYAQDFIVYGNNLIGLTNSPGVVNLAPYLDNTDNQNLTAATLTGNVLQIDIQNGTSASVDLSAISDSKWTRNSSSGFLYPTTISDKIGFGVSSSLNNKLNVESSLTGSFNPIENHIASFKGSGSLSNSIASIIVENNNNNTLYMGVNSSNNTTAAAGAGGAFIGSFSPFSAQQRDLLLLAGGSNMIRMKPVDGVTPERTIVESRLETPGGLFPAYDSGWTPVNMGNNYSFIHNLNSQMLIVQVFIKDVSGRIFNASAGSGVGLDFSGDYEGGITVYMRSISAIEIAFGNDAIFIHDNTSISGAFTKVTSGEVRVIAYKTGL